MPLNVLKHDPQTGRRSLVGVYPGNDPHRAQRDLIDYLGERYHRDRYSFEPVHGEGHRVREGATGHPSR